MDRRDRHLGSVIAAAPLFRRVRGWAPLLSSATVIKRAARALGAAACCVAFPVAAQLNLYCSSPNTAWCQGMAVGFERAAGIRVAVVQKATGEMLAQVKAEKANPKGDVWWAGPADSYLQAAEEGLLET